MSDDLLFDISKKKSYEKEKEYKKYIKKVLREDYYLICIEKCINDFNKPLQGTEKVCLAKCIDRSFDYIYSQEKYLNLYNENIQRKIFSIFPKK